MAAETRQLVVFRLGPEEFALPIESVREVIRHTEPRSVNAPQPWLRGVISLRGTIVPICDLADRLGRPPAVTDDAKIVVADTGAGLAGIVVDDVAEVLAVEESLLEPLPAAGDDALAAVVNLGGRLLVVLDVDRLLAGIELAGKPKPKPRRAPARTRRTRST
jgi:purine-binding chemotaxis protein CheW